MRASIARLTVGNDYLFGVAPVLAALQANRRKAVCVHVKASKKGETRLPTSPIARIEAAALALKIKVEHSPLSRLDKLSEGRLHQGVLMECGRLPIRKLTEVDFGELLHRQQLQTDSPSAKQPTHPHGAIWLLLDRPSCFQGVVRVAGVCAYHISAEPISSRRDAESGRVGRCWYVSGRPRETVQ